MRETEREECDEVWGHPPQGLVHAHTHGHTFPFTHTPTAFVASGPAAAGPVHALMTIKLCTYKSHSCPQAPQRPKAGRQGEQGGREAAARTCSIVGNMHHTMRGRASYGNQGGRGTGAWGQEGEDATDLITHV